MKQVLREDAVIIGHKATLAEVRDWLRKNKDQQQNFYIVSDDEGNFRGVVSSTNLFGLPLAADCCIETLILRKPVVISSEESMRTAVELMACKNMDVLPVKGTDEQKSQWLRTKTFYRCTTFMWKTNRRTLPSH